MPAVDDPWTEAVAHAVEFATREAAPSAVASWDDLVALEPQLEDVERDVASIEAGPRFCASMVWTRSLKPRMTALVGFSRGESRKQREPNEPVGDPIPWGELMQRADAETAVLRRRRQRDTRNGRGPLWTSEAYDVAYEHLYGLLPDCANDCDCQRVLEAATGETNSSSEGLGTSRHPRQLMVYRPSGEIPEPPRWLWPGRIPMRMVTLLDGDPDQGKSTVTLDIASRVTRGESFPDGTPGQARADVVLLSAEDDSHHTIEPRLMAAGADLKRVHIVTGMRDIDGKSIVPPSVPGDLDVLQELVRRTGAALVVIDPFIAYLDEGIDSYRDNQVRVAMSALKALAEEEDVAVLLVRHLKKDNAGGKAIYGGGGSIGFIAHARSAMLVGSHPEHRDVRVLTQSKLNVGIKGPSLTYSLVAWEQHPEWARVEWGDAVELRADELMVAKSERGATKKDEAEAWLLDTLADGPMRSEELEQRAEDEDYSRATYRRARKVLKDAGLLGRRKIAGDDPHWEWFVLEGRSE